MNQFKYSIIANEIKEKINNDEYAVGDRLPSESVLSSTFGVSRQTIRQALSTLEIEGIIFKRQGSGSTICPRKQPSSKNIAVMTTYITEYIFQDMLNGIEQVLSSHGYSPMVSATRNSVDKERTLLLDYLSKDIAGLIVEGTKTAFPNPNIFLYHQLESKGIPIVFVHSFYPELSSHVHIIADDVGGGFEAVKYLISKGHKNISGIFKSDDIQGHNRYLGFINGIYHFNADFHDENILWYTTESLAYQVNYFCERIVEGCTAVVCYNDEVAVRIIDTLYKNNVQIPHDMAVISFDNSAYSEFSRIRITSLANNEERIGKIAAKKLLSLIKGESEGSEVFPWKLIEKEST